MAGVLDVLEPAAVADCDFVDELELLELPHPASGTISAPAPASAAALRNTLLRIKVCTAAHPTRGHAREAHLRRPSGLVRQVGSFCSERHR